MRSAARSLACSWSATAAWTSVRHWLGRNPRNWALTAAAGFGVAVVVSAMAGETNRLDGYIREIAMLHDAREYDVVVSAGEQVTSGLLALALQEAGVQIAGARFVLMKGIGHFPMIENYPVFRPHLLAELEYMKQA